MTPPVPPAPPAPPVPSAKPAWSTAEQQTLVQLLEDQADQYQSLLHLTKQQGELVDRQDADALLSLLGRRQTFIDRLAKLNDRLQPLKQNWDDRLAALPPAGRQTVTTLVANIQQFQQAIRRQDDRDFALLEQAKNQTGQEISQLKQTAQATKSYHQAATAYRFQQPISLYTDRRG